MKNDIGSLTSDSSHSTILAAISHKVKYAAGRTRKSGTEGYNEFNFI